ncbi:hypothetical protein B0J18DRAFT_484807 [Chaetomium sp. MPI-SDFR-AT-0129]|nr:hypothetical protein B0J18DRAFT_484807 [Chaetomium sp. MPI-SDFR-AT-0129]
MDVPDIVDPTSAAAVDATNTTDHDSPVRVLVQTQTHHVPGDKSTRFGERFDAMLSLICQHVWQREFDKFRERPWDYHCHFALDNVECWFLVDHHGPHPILPADLPIVCITIQIPLPGKVRRELRHYPFERIPHHCLTRKVPVRPPRRIYKSRDEEVRVKRHMLRGTLLENLYLTDELLQFAQDFPDGAEWVKARVPPELWAKVEEKMKLLLEPEGPYLD